RVAARPQSSGAFRGANEAESGRRALPHPLMMWEPGHETARKPPFRFAVYTRVGVSDTDAQGVVYYGRYLPYFDLARTEYHRSLRWVGRTAGSEFVMRALNVEYHAPARFDDLLEVFVRIPRIGRPSVTDELEAYRLDEGSDDTLMVTAMQTSVLIDPGERGTLSVPDTFRSAVSAFEEVEL